MPVRFRLPAPTPTPFRPPRRPDPEPPLRLAFLSIGRHIHTERWIRWFADRGHECHLLTVQPGPVPGVTVHDIRRGFGPKPLRYLWSLGEVRRILGRLEPDLLNTHFLTGYGYWGHFSGCHPNVLTVWGDDVYVTPFENGLKNWLARAALGVGAGQRRFPTRPNVVRVLATGGSTK